MITWSIYFFSILQIPKMMYIGNYALCGVGVDQFGSSFGCSCAAWAGFTTRNLAFCNCLMQLVSSCMRHMQLEICPIVNDKLHEICSCMR
jgi:hypothetical protein